MVDELLATNWFTPALFVALAGLIFAGYKHYKSITHGIIKTELGFNVIPSQIVVNKTPFKNIKDLLVISFNNNEITEKLFETFIILWNSGDEPITTGESRIREKICFNFPDSSKILYAKVVCKTKYLSLEPEIEGNSVNINFKHFDRKDGVVIKVIHREMINKKDITPEGNVVGAGNKNIFRPYNTIPAMLRLKMIMKYLIFYRRVPVRARLLFVGLLVIVYYFAPCQTVLLQYVSLRLLDIGYLVIVSFVLYLGYLMTYALWYLTYCKMRRFPEDLSSQIAELFDNRKNSNISEVSSTESNWTKSG